LKEKVEEVSPKQNMMKYPQKTFTNPQTKIEDKTKQVTIGGLIPGGLTCN
jgi:hypothetical protein